MNVLEAIKMRRSVRAYSARPIPEDVVQRLCQAVRCAPSACNNQPWHFILIADPQLRKEIAQAAHGQSWIADAPIILVACGLPAQAYPRMGGSGNSVDIDVAIALDHLTLAAVAEGVGTCWIGSFSETDVKQILGVPPAVKVVAMTPLGYPAAAELIYPMREDDRKPMAQIFSQDRYQE